MLEKESFKKLLANVLMTEDELADEVESASFDTLDSMGHLTLIALLDKELNVQVRPGEIHSLQTIGDILRLAGYKD